MDKMIEQIDVIRVRSRSIVLAVLVGLLTAHIGATDAAADGVCCLPDGSCQASANEMECAGLGVYLDGFDCAFDPCGVGACCNESNDCIGETNAYNCITSGRTFGGVGTTCLDDPCDSGVGACCNIGFCTDVSPEACDATGGIWLGAGTNCGQDPCVIGSCCSPGACEVIARFECDAVGGIFDDTSSCTTDSCQLPNACATNSLFSQERDGPNAFTTYTSEQGQFVRFEDYSGVAGTIETVMFWGFELSFDEKAGAFSVCQEIDPTFLITFNEDNFGAPGNEVCNFTVTATRVNTGIDYQGLTLFEYTAELPEACVLPAGWFSISGMGDPDCWFLWMSAQNGTGTSYCIGCGTSVQGDDLAFCLGGTFGAASGACCDYTTGTCTDDVSIEDCLESGLEFHVDTTCTELGLECAVTQGACCFSNGICFLDLPTPCIVAGGDWLGPNAPCTLCPEVGACCFGDTCTQETESDCTKFSGVWLGSQSLCEDCPTLPTCPPDALFSLPPDGPSDFEAGSSELSAGFKRWQPYSGAAGVINAVTFWGIDLDHISGSTFEECEEVDPTFEIAFHTDAAGVPGAEVCSYTVTATRIPTGFLYLGTEMNQYEAALPFPCIQADGWISIHGLGDPECWFLWMSAGPGTSYCIGCGINEIDLDFAVCLQGSSGGVFGACCDDTTGTCMDATDIADCQTSGMRFELGTPCALIDPPCGVIVGACCQGDNACTIETDADCTTIGGSWIGNSSICSQCPCTPVCLPEYESEGEVDCFDDYEDNYNAGCASFFEVHREIFIGDTICGTSGAYSVGGEVTPDQDWWELTVFNDITVQWSAVAEFTARLTIVDGNSGCPGTVLADIATTACDSAPAVAELKSGFYWFAIRPLFFSDENPCGANYVVTLEELAPCPHDTDGNGAVDVDDLVAVILTWGTANPDTDVNDDGVVNVDDLVDLILNWGPCPGTSAVLSRPPPVDAESIRVQPRVSAEFMRP